jgi:hypothetical protein
MSILGNCGSEVARKSTLGEGSPEKVRLARDLDGTMEARESRCFMVISEFKIVETKDVSRFSWARINRFQNVDYVASLIERLHQIPTSQKANVRKQAEQVKYCLAQAKEYFDA